MKKTLSNNHGLTLLEVLIALTVLGFMMAVFSNLFMTTGRYYALMKAKNRLHQEVETTLEFCAAELRGATGFALDSCGRQELVFINQQGETVWYQLQDGALFRVVGGVREPLAGSVSNWEIEYAGDDFNDPGRFILLTLTLEIMSALPRRGEVPELSVYSGSISIQPRVIQGVFNGEWVE